MFARTRGARPASESEAARTFIVELQRKDAGIAGTLVVEETGGASVARHVTGSACGNVASVLALATALAIDPRAELAPHQALEPAAPREPPPAPPSAPGPPVSDVPAQAAREDRAGAWSARASLGASAAFGIAPRPFLGPSALLALRRDRAPLEEVGLGLVSRLGAPELVRGARADFRFYAARPTLCIRRIQLAAPFSIAPCFSFEAGVVTATGSDLPVALGSTRFWAAAELLLRLEYSLPARFFITLEGGAAVPLTRYRFVFRNPDTPIYEVPALTAQAALHAGLGF